MISQNNALVYSQNVIEETSHDDDENLRVLNFARSPIMSTYLLAFVVGEFDYVEGETDDGILVRVYTPLGKKEQGQFALEVRIVILCYMSCYYCIFTASFSIP